MSPPTQYGDNLMSILSVTKLFKTYEIKKMFQETKEGILFKIKVIPKATYHEIVGWETGELKIRLAAVPAKGEANEELIKFLAKQLAIGRSKICLVQGKTSRHKKICVQLSLDELKIKLNRFLVC